MALFVVRPWAEFFAGVVTGCWIGAVIACVGVLLLVGRRVRQLEGINLLLRTKLKAGLKPSVTATAGSGPTLVMPLPGSIRKTEPPRERIARVH
ncbi:MAG TPA: hypothetical protein VGF88_18430 [Acidobacteriaceae bacterium]|jgi:hypothetical protein